jgi:hypothetical protein
MRGRIGLAALAALALGACASPNTEWMKINEPYTVAEFRRDLDECTIRGTVDEACMRRHGWVAVTAPRTEKKELPQYRPGVPQQRY